MKRMVLSTSVALLLASASMPAHAEEIMAREVSDSSEAGSTTEAHARGELVKDAGWNGQWALLFQLNNIFSDGGSAPVGFLGEFGEVGIGGMYMLDSKLAIRGGFGYSRNSSPVPVIRETNSTGGAGNEITTYQTGSVSNTTSSSFQTRVDALYRLIAAQVAPYVGAGLFYDFGRDRFDFVDEVSVQNQKTTTHFSDSTHAWGLAAILGAEWRLHPNFALFAEYNLRSQIFGTTRSTGDVVVENTTAGATTTRREQFQSHTPRWLNFATGLEHGAQLGLAVHFQ